AAEMAGVESLDGRQSVASGAKRLRDSLRGVADGTGNANAGDGGLPADALAPQWFAQNLHAALPRRRFEAGGMLRFLAPEEFVPQLDELLAQFVRGQVQRAGYDVGAVVMRPVEIEDAALALQA